MSATDEKIDSLYKIGAVSKITNIPVDTLRIWERRYSVVVPVRSKNSDRLYKSSHINRLTLLKMLVDKGHSIGTIAHLSNDELSKRLNVHATKAFTTNKKVNNRINVVAVGEVLSIQIQHTESKNNNFLFNHIYHNDNDFLENYKYGAIDVLVIEYPAIHEDHIDKINKLFQKSGAEHLILIYGFTNSAARKKLDKTQYTYIQAPISIDNLQREIIELVKDKKTSGEVHTGIELDEKAPGRHYSNKQLIELSTGSTVIQCECPQHLSSLVIKLVQFENYSLECIERFDKDADLHAMLAKMAGHSRSILEKALFKVIEIEKYGED